MILSERKSFGVVQLKLSTDAPSAELLFIAQPVVDVEPHTAGDNGMPVTGISPEWSGPTICIVLCACLRHDCPITTMVLMGRSSLLLPSARVASGKREYVRECQYVEGTDTEVTYTTGVAIHAAIQCCA
jgi:hypothetical protein